MGKHSVRAAIDVFGHTVHLGDTELAAILTCAVVLIAGCLVIWLMDTTQKQVTLRLELKTAPAHCCALRSTSHHWLLVLGPSCIRPSQVPRPAGVSATEPVKMVTEEGLDPPAFRREFLAQHHLS